MLLAPRTLEIIQSALLQVEQHDSKKGSRGSERGRAGRQSARVSAIRLSPGGNWKQSVTNCGQKDQGGTREQAQGQGQLSFSARINVGTWLFPMSSRAACCLLLLPGEYRKPIIIQTRHLHFIIMNEGWRTRNNGQLVRWSDGQLVSSSAWLSHLIMSLWVNLLIFCAVQIDLQLSLFLSICIDYCRSARWHVRGVANLHGNRHASEGRERDPESGGVMQNISQLVNKCAWTEVNECHLINVSSPKRRTTWGTSAWECFWDWSQHKNMI